MSAERVEPIAGDLLGTLLMAPWRIHAACRGEAPRGPDTDEQRHHWFPEWGETPQPGRDTCARCPVRIDCLTWALDRGERFGIWGGLTRTERKYCTALMEVRDMPLPVAMLEAQRYRSRKRVAPDEVRAILERIGSIDDDDDEAVAL